MMSDDSENDGVYMDRSHENNIYFKKYKLLLEECDSIQKNNERLVYRIEEVKKITKRRLDQIEYIRNRLLSKYGEDWTDIPQKQIKIEKEDEETSYVSLIKPIKEEVKEEPVEEKPTPPAKPKKITKRKTPKSEKDPNAPKRPSNPFFQFCQEQRQPLLEKLISDLKPGEVEPSKQELTRQLALRWKSISATDKQIYVDMYERSKEKYAAEMTEYNSKK